MRSKILFFLIAITSMVANAQIGYQVALLNNVTGEPRANESVSVEVKITDGEGKTVCSETKSATTNEFGILSLSVGSNEVFDKVDWSKQPFFISATIDDVLIGKSQILSVPIAEYAKRTGQLTKDFLKSRKWEMKFYDKKSSGLDTYIISFDDDNIYKEYDFYDYNGWSKKKDTYPYTICNNVVLAPEHHMIFNFDSRKAQFWIGVSFSEFMTF